MSDKNTFTHAWEFAPRFRRNAFGWRSAPARKRIREAVSEIKKVARKDPVCAAAGAVRFLEKVAPAIQRVDSSSGAIGRTVNQAIDVLVGIIARADADDATRNQWLERLWEAIEEDEMPYLELLPMYWGDLCVTPERANQWAELFIGVTRHVFQEPGYCFSNGSMACFSALFTAQRYADILDLLSLYKYDFGDYHIWGARALTAMHERDAAPSAAEESPVARTDPL